MHAHHGGVAHENEALRGEMAATVALDLREGIVAIETKPGM